MTDLPPGWIRASLDELGVELQSGFASGKHNRDGIGVQHIRPMNITRGGALDLSDARYVEDDTERRVVQGDVLFNNTNSPELVGKTTVVQAREPLAYSNHMTRVRPPIGIDARFLAHQLHWLWMKRYFHSVMSNHVNQASVSTKVLARTNVSIPPLAEQCRIAATLEDHLSRLDVGIRLIGVNEQRLVQYHESVVSDQLTLRGCGEPIDAGPSLDSAGVDDGALPQIPPSWRWYRLQDIAEIVGGITKDAAKQGDPAMPLVPYLRVANVQRGQIDLSNVAEIRATPKQVDKLRLQEGDVLLNEGGDRDKLGRGWVWDGRIDPCIHQNHVFRARIRGNILHPKLLAWHANSFGKSWCERNGKQSVNLASISLSKIKLLPVPVPPRDQQESIVGKIDVAEVQMRKLQETLNAGKIQALQLRRSLLTDAFAGRLVEQDPNDEPAYVLLERIAAERAAAPKPKRARKTKNTQGSAQ